MSMPSKIALNLDVELPAPIKRVEKRYETLMKALQKTTFPDKTAKVHDTRSFTEKRAALQERCKIAVGAGGLARAATKISPLWKQLVSKEGLLIGGPLIGLGLAGAPLVGELGERLRRKVYGDPLQRANMPETAAIEYAKAVGKNLGTETVGLLGNVLSTAIGIPGQVGQRMTRRSIFDMLKQEDDVIAQADPQQLEEAYHTMARFAPTLATDKNAVKTFLRESVLYGTGPNFMAIKQLADAEQAVLGPQSPSGRR